MIQSIIKSSPNDKIGLQLAKIEILYALDRLAEDYLETQKKLWMSNFKSKILHEK